MTVASDLKTAVASLKSAQVSFEQFALGTQNQQAKNLYTNLAQSTQRSWGRQRVYITRPQRLLLR